MATCTSTTERIGAPWYLLDPGAADLSTRRVAVLLGGCSGEREVSLESGRAIAAALRELGRGERGPAQVLEIEITAEGRWRLEGRERSCLQCLAELEPVDLYFLGLHGAPGEDGTLQGFLETARQGYTGSGVGASAVCMDKLHARAVVASAGLRVARAACVDACAWSSARARCTAEIDALGSSGLSIKPRRGGSSVGVAILESSAGAAQAIERVLALGDDALVEERICGIEVTCPVLGNQDTQLCSLSPVEIQPAHGRFFDYEQKYSAQGARECCPPESLSASECAHLRALAERAHRTLGCDGYSRTDFIVPRDGTGYGEPVFLELNTLPGMTARSLLPLSAAHAGISFPELCRFLAAAGLAASRRRLARGAS